MSLVKILEFKYWSDTLFSICVEKPSDYVFIPGQYAKIKLIEIENNPMSHTQQSHWKSYSIISTPQDNYLEFLVTVVSHGVFTPALSKLKIGDSIELDSRSFGILTSHRLFINDYLFLIASGSGLGPFVSMLNEQSIWEQFPNIILIHSVKHENELAYYYDLSQYVAPENKQFIYIPIATRGISPYVHINGLSIELRFSERITSIILNNQLESIFNKPISKDNSSFMLCGNPEMVQDVRSILENKQYELAKVKTQGHIAIETYW